MEALLASTPIRSFRTALSFPDFPFASLFIMHMHTHVSRARKTNACLLLICAAIFARRARSRFARLKCQVVPEVHVPHEQRLEIWVGGELDVDGRLPYALRDDSLIA